MGTGTTNGALWGAHAKTWSEKQEPLHAPLWTAMLDAADVGPGTHLLDVGCGAGGALKIALERGAEVAGMDASEALLAIARVAAPGAYVAGDMEALPFEDAAFDVVMATNAVQYAGDPVRAVRELRRVVKPAGRVVVGMWAEPDKNDMSAVFAAVRGVAPPPPTPVPPRDLAVRDNLLALLAEGGLRVARDGEVACRFTYRDESAYWTAQRSAGIMEGAAKRIGEALLRAVVIGAGKPYMLPDGRIDFRNTFRWVLATPL